MTDLKNEWLMFVQMAFRSRKVFGAFEKRTPELNKKLVPNIEKCTKMRKRITK